MLGKGTDIKNLSDNTKKYNIYVIRVLEGEEKFCSAEKNTKKKDVWKLPRFDERHKPIDSRRWVTPKEDKSKGIFLSHFTNY